MGILANSASVSMASSSSDDVKAGYVVGEQIVLSTTPAGSRYSWGTSLPSGSAPLRSALSATDIASPRFTPDVAGVYVVVCDVDGTPYVLRLSVTMRATISIAQALRFSPVPDDSVAAPAVGAVLYFSSDQDALVTKDSAGAIATIDTTAVP